MPAALCACLVRLLRRGCGHGAWIGWSLAQARCHRSGVRRPIVGSRSRVPIELTHEGFGGSRSPSRAGRAPIPFTIPCASMSAATSCSSCEGCPQCVGLRLSASISLAAFVEVPDALEAFRSPRWSVFGSRNRTRTALPAVGRRDVAAPGKRNAPRPAIAGAEGCRRSWSRRRRCDLESVLSVRHIASELVHVFRPRDHFTSSLDPGETSASSRRARTQ